MEVIKHCPFCGSEAILLEFSMGDNQRDHQDIAVVQCKFCKARGNEFRAVAGLVSKASLADKAIKSWNCRDGFPEHVKNKSRWIIDGTGCRCESCGCKIPLGVINQVDFHYCPNCGSPM